MALPLGTQRGRLEVNSIFRIPIENGKVISVPEVEGTIRDGLGLELEVEFEGSRQTGWSAAAQWTLGRGIDNQFIHGLQVIVERENPDQRTDIVALYIPAFRFSPVWSTMVMIGIREPVSGEGQTRFVFNGSVFAETSHSLTLGLEINSRADNERTENLEIVPQIHWGASDHIAVQAGIGFARVDDSTKTEAMLRAIYAF